MAAIKQAVRIPVFANGDITTPERAQQAVEQTGCDGVMIGRGALGDPWLFGRVNTVLAGQAPPAPPTLAQRMAALRRQVYEMCEEKGEWAAMPQGAQPGHALYERPARGRGAAPRLCPADPLYRVDVLIDAVFRCNE